MKAVQLARRDGIQDDDLRAGEYSPRPPGAEGIIVLRCVGCESLGQLLRSVHSVDLVSGEVRPVVKCPRCQFACYLVLADWIPESRGSA